MSDCADHSFITKRHRTKCWLKIVYTKKDHTSSTCLHSASVCERKRVNGRQCNYYVPESKRQLRVSECRPLLELSVEVVNTHTQLPLTTLPASHFYNIQINHLISTVIFTSPHADSKNGTLETVADTARSRGKIRKCRCTRNWSC